MSKCKIQNETLYHTLFGWYWFRDTEGDGIGEYLFENIQCFHGDPIIEKEWHSGYPMQPVYVKYFKSRNNAIESLRRVVAA